MSVTTDRMDAIIARTVPVPFDPSQLVHLPYWPELFNVVVALGQAWPATRDEIHHLENRCAELIAANDQLTAEHERIARTVEANTNHRNEESRRDKLTILELVRRLDTMTDAYEAAAARVANVPARTVLAEKVCRSVDPHHTGHGGTWAWIDGAAWDAWKAVAPCP